MQVRGHHAGGGVTVQVGGVNVQVGVTVQVRGPSALTSGMPVDSRRASRGRNLLS